VSRRCSSCFEKQRPRRFGPRDGPLQDPVKIELDRVELVKLLYALAHDVFVGCDHKNRLVRRDIQSMGRMSARLYRVRPLLCGGAFMALRWCDGKGRDLWDAGADRKRTSSAYWRGPPRWNERAEAESTRLRVFCASVADVFDNKVPTSMARRFVVTHPLDTRARLLFAYEKTAEHPARLRRSHPIRRRSHARSCPVVRAPARRHLRDDGGRRDAVGGSATDRRRGGGARHRPL
jgi:hypothetical protein